MNLFAQQLLAGDAPKLLGSGSHRTVPPEKTWAKLEPHFEKLGISRTGLITGLDRIGFPVAQAVRPFSKSMIVSQGKGQTETVALLSAAMEAAEQWHAEQVLNPIVSKSRAELRCHTDAMELWTYDHQQNRSSAVLDQKTIRWVLGHNVMDGQPCHAPLDLVDLDYTQPQDTDFLVKSSAGLGAGNTLPEALSCALLELIERDANAEFRELGHQERAARRVPDTLLEAYGLTEFLKTSRTAAVNLDVWDTTSDIGIPSYWAAVTDIEMTGQPPAGGAGCHLDPKLAAYRAISEAFQSRLTFISGAREDINPDRYLRRHSHSMDVLFASMFERQGSKSNLRKDISRPSAGGDIEVILEHLSAINLKQAIFVDLTHPEIGIPVVRALIPGLGIHLAGNRFSRGRRVLDPELAALN